MKTLLALVLVAAGAHAADIDSRPFAEQVTVTDSEFESTIKYAGPDGIWKTKPTDTLRVKVLIVKDRRGAPLKWAAILQADYYSSTWRFYDSVNVLGGAVFKVQQLGRNALGCEAYQCHFLESGVIWFTDDEVKAGLDKGLKMRWNATNLIGGFETEFPNGYFRGLSDAVK